MHTMERYFNSEPENLDLTDGISEALMRTVMDNARILVREPGNLKARAEIMGGLLSHNGLTGCGTDGVTGPPICWNMRWAACLTWPMAPAFRHLGQLGPVCLAGAPDRFVKFARNVMGITGQGTDAEIVEQGIQAVEQFYREIKMPTLHGGAGHRPPPRPRLREMASKSVAEGTVKVLSYEDQVAIFQAAL